MKEEIRQFISQGKLEDALASMSEWVRQTQATQYLNEITLLRGRLETVEAQTRKGILDVEDIQREHNQIADTALEVLGKLPEKAPLPAKRKRGIREKALKQHIFYLLIAMKVVVLGWLYTHWESGGFSLDQFTGTLTLLIPVLATYAGLMFQDFLDNRYVSEEAEENSPLVKRNVQFTIYAIMIVYAIALISFIGMKARGTLSFAQMAGFFTLVESFIGIYLSRIVKTFFKVEAAT